MSEKIKDRAVHFVVSFLLAAGILMPLLGALDPVLASPVVLIWAAGLLLLFGLLSLHNTVSVVSAIGLPLLAGVWLYATNRIYIIQDVIAAVILRFRGVDTALPLVAEPVVIFLTVLVSVLAHFACSKEVPVIQPALGVLAMILLLYLAGAEAYLVWFLPALAAILIIFMTGRFRETPVLPLIPAAALLVAGAFLLSGNGIGPNPLRDRADELRQAILDRLFFTEPRDVFSLSTEGLYPEGQDQLGGKPNPDGTPVMQVSTPRTVYLRGVILNEYTGRNWRNTTGGRRYLRQSPRLAPERAALFDEDLPPMTVRNSLCDPATVSVRMLSDSASTLFVPQRVRDLNPGGDLVPYFSNSSELFITRNLKAGDTYSVSAPLFMAGDPGLGTLIEVCSTLDDSRYDRVIDTYTALPDHLEEPVYALARDAASVASSPYDKALAIQSWLSRSFRYTLDVEYQPANLDFVTSFLLYTKEGYCTYFASAMTVLCRMAGLPARYVEGYLAEPNEYGEALVTGLSAHAWTEVYFKGFGWLTFDATPHNHSGSGGDSDGDDPTESPEPGPTPTPTPEPPENRDPEETPTPEPEENEPSPEPTPEESPEPTPEESPESSPEQTPEDTPVPPDSPDEPQPSPPPDEQAGPQDDREPDPPGSFPWLWLLLALLAAAAAARVWVTSPLFRERRAKTDNARFDVWAQEVTDLLHAEGITRAAGESPMAFGRRIDRSGQFGIALGPVGECVSLIRYSRAVPGDTDTGLVRDTSILLKGELSRPARLRYLLRRFFIPLRKRDSL